MWFKSKLQNPDPEIRRQHLDHLAPEDEMLIEMARTDPHRDVRSAALTRIIDLNALQELAGADADERIRSQATARLQVLLSGAETPSPPLDSRLDFLKSSRDGRLISFVACSAEEPELRKIAVSRLLDRQNEPAVQDLLCEIAADDSVGEIRQTAAEPIHDLQRLQTLLEKTRDRDKSIHRLARERLDKIEEQRAAYEELQRCCLAVEQLCDPRLSADGKVEKGRLAQLVVDWDKAAAIAKTMDEQLHTRFRKGCKLIDAKLAGLEKERRERADIMAALQLHLTETTGEPVAGLIKRWHDLDEASPQQARDFAKLVAEVTEHDSQLDRDNHRVVAKQALLKKMEQAAAAETIRKTALPQFEERWEAAHDPEDEEQKNELRNQFLSLREKLRAKLDKQDRELEQRVAEVAVLLDRYETALEEGKLQIVGSTHDKIVSALRKLEAPQEKKQGLVKRLRAGEPKMAELRRWRHWGTEKKREELCELVESLSTTDMKIPAVAKAVRESREAWKALDRSDGPSARKLWRRFDSACEKAYEPCQALFDQQGQRKENMARRMTICAELEELEKNTDWDTPPWRDVADAMRDTERRWRLAGSVDRRERNTIQKRYDTVRAAIDERLSTMRQREVERREALISRVEELAGLEDNARAVDTAKRAQREWKPVVQSGRRMEQELWKRFREACDAVFERRKEQFAAADHERTQNLGEKLAVCGQIEEFTGALKIHLDAGTGDADVVRETRKKARQLSSGWQRIGAVPREKQQSVEQRFRAGCQELEQLCGRLDRQINRQARQALRDAAAECGALELAAAAGDGIDAAVVGKIQSTLAELSAGASLDRRLERLQAAAGGDARAQKEIADELPANLETRLRLCLEMEIAANIDSPAEFRQERMQYRVKQLSESMSGNRQSPGPAELERLWYETGPVPESDRTVLDERFQRALEALSGD